MGHESFNLTRDGTQALCASALPLGYTIIRKRSAGEQSQDNQVCHFVRSALIAISHLDPAAPACGIRLQIVKLPKSVHVSPFVPDLVFITGKERLRHATAPVLSLEAILTSRLVLEVPPSEASEENAEHIEKGGGVLWKVLEKKKLVSEAVHWNSHF